MSAVGFVYNSIYLEHDTGEYHPERKSRLLSIRRHLGQSGLLSSLTVLDAYRAELEWVRLVHDFSYIERLRLACEGGLKEIDTSDCIISSMTYEAALWACGGVLSAIDELMSSRLDRVFCALRPPGHHAENSHAMGFCYFNNIAIAARYLQECYGVGRVFILDFDVHHGNGTQHSFEEDDSIFYASMHEDPRYCYPGTGYASELGRGRGRGYTLNCPLLPGTGDDEYLRVFRQKLIPALSSFKPDFILLSAGFDGHKDDPLAGLELTERVYEELTRELVIFANDFCGGRIVSILEGGYNLLALARSVSVHISALIGS